MVNHDIRNIAGQVDASFLNPDIIDMEISNLCIDSRNIIYAPSSLFFALKGNISDGHKYIAEAYEKGVRNFVVSGNVKTEDFPRSNFLYVEDARKALQKLTAYHRHLFPNLKTIGITGSNGKTTIKEWLFQLLHDEFYIVKSPKSYNSQIGVPLSVWQIAEEHNLGIFEAGISEKEEMEKLAPIINPQIGLMTNIGDAHDSGFTSRTEKLEEKLKLFAACEKIIYNNDDAFLDNVIKKHFPLSKLFSWGRNDNGSVFNVSSIEKKDKKTEITISISSSDYSFSTPFMDDASIQNMLHCIAILLVLEIPIIKIQEKISGLEAIAMRLEMNEGINHTILINDAYNADIASLKIALDFLVRQGGQKSKTIIISDFPESGTDTSKLIAEISMLINAKKINKLITIGNKVKDLLSNVNCKYKYHFSDTEAFSKRINELNFHDEFILLKGARKYKFERIFQALSLKNHGARLEINLSAMENNFSIYSSMLSPSTKIIAVIKASAYGSGSVEIARFLEYRKVHYLAVAFTDEGVLLRKAGIRTPIIILNPEQTDLSQLIQYRLEPEVYSVEQLKMIADYLNITKQTINIHLKVDSGMNRLGITFDQTENLIPVLRANPAIKIQSVFSHLSSSEDEKDDAFTDEQFSRFNEIYNRIRWDLKIQPIKHILNTAGIVRFADHHYDAVRIGLGLYGIDYSGLIQHKLEKVHTLKAKVIQLKKVRRGASAGYNRKWKAAEDSLIAIVNIGYADGLLRTSGNEKYAVIIKEKEAPIIGNICMDLTTVDVSHIPDVRIGEDVIIFGKQKPIEHLAKINNTIPYEILSRISERVKRVFIQE